MGEDAPAEKLLELWTRLGDICLDHLGDTEAATEAYQVACELAPDDVARHEQLADLYLEAGEARRDEAIGELQFLLGHAPDRVELYKALANLYRAEHELDKACCVAQALVFLGAASDEERLLYEQLRPAQFTPAPRRLTEELWQKSIIHPREDRHVGAIFASTLGALAAGTAQPITAFGLVAATRARISSATRAPVSRIVKYVTGVLAIDPAPMVWLQEHGRRPARRQHGRPRRRAPAAGAVAARRRAAARQERRARARVRGRQADGVPAAGAVRDARARHAAQARGAFAAAVLAGGARLTRTTAGRTRARQRRRARSSRARCRRRSRARCSSRSASCRRS